MLRLPLHESAGFLPDIDGVPPAVWDRAALVWVNYPNNPTGAVAPAAFYDRLAGLAARHGFLLASDEAYSELYFDGEPPASAIQAAERGNVAVLNTLSKRSSMTGYRSGFVAGSPELIAALKSFRPTVGTAPQEFVQRAAVAAWSDETHVEEARERYRVKRGLIAGALRGAGLHIAGSAATMYLWVRVPAGETSEGFAGRLIEHGIVVAPGAFLGPAGEGYVRFALVPTIDDCRAAAAILEDVL